MRLWLGLRLPLSDQKGSVASACPRGCRHRFLPVVTARLPLGSAHGRNWRSCQALATQTRNAALGVSGADCAQRHAESGLVCLLNAAHSCPDVNTETDRVGGRHSCLEDLRHKVPSCAVDDLTEASASAASTRAATTAWSESRRPEELRLARFVRAHPHPPRAREVIGVSNQ